MMKKIPIRLVLWLSYILAIGAGTLGSMRIVANATSTEESGEAGKMAHMSRSYYENWYEVSADGSELVLKLENHIPGYAWRLGSSNDNVLKTVDHYYDKYDDRIIVLEPSAGRSGDVVLTAACMKDINSKPIDRRQILVHIYEDGHLTVTENKRAEVTR